ncbi:hypothetical protein [Streptomyces rimosus]|uniref:hypothetical protein n=1 Tax=Streptomyces rimosus TaxID=1927 RepID=UPI0004C0FE31|nr:hypothetical protein [Streptomyces rimosus]
MADDNRVLVWDGQQWAEGARRVWSGTEWRLNPGFAVWDGSAWAWKTPEPVEFPPYAYGTKGSFTKVDTATLRLPDQIRLGDTVVSICASYGESPPIPRMMAAESEVEYDPLRAVYAASLDPTKLHLKVSMFQWAPSKGPSVSWRVSGQKDTNAVVMNLVYRQVDSSRLPAEPIVDYRTAMNVDRLDLQPGTDYQSLYVAVALSRELTGNRWPEGFTSPREEFGQFGDLQVHMMTANTVGAPSSPGTLQLDATVPQLAVALITIPGKAHPDGHGVWILGDQSASVLGKTTYLE